MSRLRVVEVRLELGGHFVEAVLAEGDRLDLGAPPRVLPEAVRVDVGPTAWTRHVYPATGWEEAATSAIVCLQSARQFPRDPEAAARCVRRGLIWVAAALASG